MSLAGIINCMSTSHLSTGVIHTFTITALTQKTQGTHGTKTLFARIILSPHSNNYHHSSRLVITMLQSRINITALSGRGGGRGQPTIVANPIWHAWLNN